MKSIFRIYAKTSKGNDNYLFNQLKQFGLSPRYDSNLNAFFFNSNFKSLFDISFRCMTVQQMYVQIGQKFRLIDQQQILMELQKLPFKNYMPIQRGLIQNTTLKILIRQSVHIPSQNVLINLVQTTLNKQIVKKEYFKNILGSNVQEDPFFEQNENKRQLIKKQRKNIDSYYQIKDIVEKKWYQEDLIVEQNNKKRQYQLQKEITRLQNQEKKILLSLPQKNQKQGMSSKDLSLVNQQNISVSIKNLKQQVQKIKNFDKEQYLQDQLVYNPHLIFYVNKNRGRILLKLNTNQLYKHGWKNAVNWGPIRQSIAASVLHNSKLLKPSAERNANNCLKIWDPMCGSGTLPLVATTILDSIPVRKNDENIFLWKKWPIYKEQYLQTYQKEIQAQKKEKKLKCQLVLSDKDRQAINYSIDNFRNLVHDNKDLIISNKAQGELFPSKNILSPIFQLQQNKIGFVCGDFEEVLKILLPKEKQGIQNFQKLNIITNIPYLHGRSEQKYPLNQLKSLYRRFSQMIRKNIQFIENVFIIIDRNTNDRNHFIHISNQKWNLISQYKSGGMDIGLYAWDQNQIKSTYQEETNMINLDNHLNEQQKQLILKKQKSLETALIQYRKKLSQIDRKYYRLPKHLIRDRTGWKRILQKRRRRHLQSAYELFAKRRDKMVAFKRYAKLKLELKMLRRGTIWKNKNLRFFNNNNQKLEKYSEQIKGMFQKRIQQALKRQQQAALRRKIKQGDKIQIVKLRNKWNNDEKKMVKQIRKSNSSFKRTNNYQSKVRRK